MKSAFKGIVTVELNKIKHSTLKEQSEILASDKEDSLWEYNCGQPDLYSAEIEYQELLIEMERLLYEDMREESIRKGNEWSLLLNLIC